MENRDVGKTSRYNSTEVGSLEVTVVDVSWFVLISIRKTKPSVRVAKRIEDRGI